MNSAELETKKKELIDRQQELLFLKQKAKRLDSLMESVNTIGFNMTGIMTAQEDIDAREEYFEETSEERASDENRIIEHDSVLDEMLEALRQQMKYREALLENFREIGIDEEQDVPTIDDLIELSNIGFAKDENGKFIKLADNVSREIDELDKQINEIEATVKVLMPVVVKEPTWYQRLGKGFKSILSKIASGKKVEEDKSSGVEVEAEELDDVCAEASITTTIQRKQPNFLDSIKADVGEVTVDSKDEEVLDVNGLDDTLEEQPREEIADEER